jgi:hypothetical protein
MKQSDGKTAPGLEPVYNWTAGVRGDTHNPVAEIARMLGRQFGSAIMWLRQRITTAQRVG